MKKTITRRTLAGVMLTAAVTARTAPQAPVAAESEAQAAVDQNRRDAADLDKVPLTTADEPAFHFTA
jgi:hypothetical protein